MTKRTIAGATVDYFAVHSMKKMSLPSKRKKVKILVQCLGAYSCVIKSLKQKQIK